MAPSHQTDPPMPGDTTLARKMARALAHTRPDELDCDACFDAMDRFAELVMQGLPAHEALPLVHDHLQRCTDCREEFEALLAALRETG